jgi:hypothetical protein
VSAPLIQEGEVSRWRKLEPNYIDTLLADSNIAALVASQPGDKTSLLQTLLRHSMLLEYASATAAIAGTELRDPELIDLVNGVPLSTTWKRLLDLKVPAVTGTKTIREHLDSLQAFNVPQVATLGAFRESLEHLQGLDSEALQFLMQGTIDLASNRVVAQMPIKATNVGIAGNGVWVWGDDGASRVDSATNAMAQAVPPTCPGGTVAPWRSLRVGANGVWLSCGTSAPAKGSSHEPPSVLRRLDSDTGAVVADILLPTSVVGFNYTGFTLQSTTNLVSPAFWNPVSPAPDVVNGQKAVTNCISSTRQFYRLSQ